MSTASGNINQLDPEQVRLLFADWFVRIAKDDGLDVETRGSGGGTYRFAIGGATEIVASSTNEYPFLSFAVSGAEPTGPILAIVDRARQRLDSVDLGGEFWYTSTISEKKPDVASLITGLFVAINNNMRIGGWRRLGARILLEFSEVEDDEKNEGPQLFAPPAVVKIHVLVPGPVAGSFSQHVAHRIVEIVSAICTFALGRPFFLPVGFFPTKDEDTAALEARRLDGEIYNLARQGVSLDVFRFLDIPGGFLVFERLRSALLTYDAAVKQHHDEVGSMMFVVAAECLTVPPTRWRHERLSKRFQVFFLELVSDALDQVVQHDNFEQAFNITRGSKSRESLQKKLIDKVYGLRSGLVHEGLRPSYAGMMPDMQAQIRRVLVAEIVENGILGYLQKPRTCFVGHPEFESTDRESASHDEA